MGELKEPTREQKHIIRANMLFSDMWLVKEETPDMLVVVYRYGKTEKQLDKNVNLWKRGKQDGICTKINSKRPV